MGLHAGRAAFGIVKRIVPVVALVVLVNEAQAVNQIVSVTGSGSWGCNLIINGISSPYIYSSTTTTSAQSSFNSTYGSGKITITKPASVVYLEFTGAWANTAISYTLDDVAVGSPVVALYQAATTTTTGGGGGSPTELSVLQTIYTRLGDVKDSIDAQNSANTSYQTKSVFLQQACVIALCMIWGAYFWRMIILAKNQSRIF